MEETIENKQRTLLGFALLLPRVCCLVVEESRPSMLVRFNEVRTSLEALARQMEVYPWWQVSMLQLRFTFASGTVIYFHHADAPERLRGLCPDAVWVPAGAMRKLPDSQWHFRTNAGAESRMFTTLF